MHVLMPPVLPVLASVLDLADNFFISCVFIFPLVANLFHVRNTFFESSSCMYTKEGQPAFHVIPRSREFSSLFLGCFPGFLIY
jgi:hypothetical protein